MIKSFDLDLLTAPGHMSFAVIAAGDEFDFFFLFSSSIHLFLAPASVFLNNVIPLLISPSL